LKIVGFEYENEDNFILWEWW